MNDDFFEVVHIMHPNEPGKLIGQVADSGFLGFKASRAAVLS